MTRWLTRRLRRFAREEGQAAFEFVLILPFFVLFLLLLVDFALLGFSYVSVANAAREGARYGAVNCGADACTSGLITDRVIERSSGVIYDPANVTVSWPEGTDRGDPVSVSVQQDYNFLFFPASIPVVSCSEMRLEQREASAPSGGSGC
jgi:Flp pilus assembly protein TadG